MKQPATSEEDRLFAAIPRRQTNRSIYEPRGIAEEVLERLQTVAGKAGTWLQLIQDAQTRQTIADLIVAGDRRQWAEKSFRQELAEWVYPRASGNVDGLPGSARAKGSFHEMTSPFVVRTFDLWREEAARDRQFAAGAPILAVLGTFADSPGDWFAAGMAAEHVLLKACISGLQTAFVNQPIEVPSLRTWLCQALGHNDFPQLIKGLVFEECFSEVSNKVWWLLSSPGIPRGFSKLAKVKMPLVGQRAILSQLLFSTR